MNHRQLSFIAVLLSVGLAVVFSWATTDSSLAGDVADTPHNLSRSGPGPVRSVSESEICIFCHTPHNSAPRAPLWNRNDPGGTYTLYESSTLKAEPGQPTGASRLCLSCHDGTIALGSVLSRDRTIDVSGGPFIEGRSNIGLDLSNDHPVSLSQSEARSRGAVDLVTDPHIDGQPLLDKQGQVQCTSCHDPHSNDYGNFLRTDPTHGALCRACHEPVGWDQSSHSTSVATWSGEGTDPWPDSEQPTVASNGCGNCHVSHGAEGRERLLHTATEEGVCLTCHSGNVASKDIQAEFSKPSGHDPRTVTGVHDPVESVDGRATHVECVDCHSPHRTNASPAVGGSLPGSLRGVSGMTTAGTPIGEATAEQQVCYKCHADDGASNATRIPRVVNQANVLRSFRPSNPSFHPVEAPGSNREVPSLKVPWTTASTMRCTDCHNNDDGPSAGGTGPRGPHGSRWPMLLERRYDRSDPNVESPAAYALCYKCHERGSILADESFPLHRMHVVDQKTSCSVCHDAHGIDGTFGNATNNSHLVNFDTRTVKKNSADRLEFRDLGALRGTCNLKCHDKDHVDLGY